VQTVFPALDRHREPIPFRQIGLATETERILVAVGEITHAPAHDPFVSLHGILDRTQFLALCQPRQQTHGLDRIALT